VFAQAAAIAYVIEVPAFMLLKNLIRRPRPADSVEALNAFIKPADRFSFPSGHTAAASVMATLICVFFPDPGHLVHAERALDSRERVIRAA